MGAKNKLNAAHLQGAALVAAMIGILTESFTAFWLSLVVIVVAAIISGEIRR